MDGFQRLIYVCNKQITSYMDRHNRFEGVLNSQTWGFTVAPVLQQRNGYDCGVLVYQFLKHLVKYKVIPSWTVNDCQLLRHLMAWEMLENHVHI